jgi:putative oxidoreductase
MKRILSTDLSNSTALIARIALGVVVFPHGAQKLLGWFGGYGFEGTMGFLTGAVGLPWIVGLLVILIEFFGALFLIFGFATRVAALAVIGNFIGVVISSHLNSGFFMNWSAHANQGEGLEYFILLFGLALVSLIDGGGRASVDGLILKREVNRSNPRSGSEDSTAPTPEEYPVYRKIRVVQHSAPAEPPDGAR